MHIKLISYNIWHGTHLKEVNEFLRQEQADIICLQEVGTSGQAQAAAEVNIFKAIEGELGIPGWYERMFWGDNGKGKYDVGNAIITKLPIQNKVLYRYERGKTNQVLDAAVKDRYDLPRVLMGAKVMVKNHSLWVLTTHHTITPEGGVTEHQLKNTRRVKEFLAGYDRYLLAGDMNTPYGNANYELLSEGLTDLSSPLEPTLHPTIHPVGGKGYHVDYVFAKGERIKQISTRIPLVDASDHLPVVVELELV